MLFLYSAKENLAFYGKIFHENYYIIIIQVITPF
jgi:hypothetical protein